MFIGGIQTLVEALMVYVDRATENGQPLGDALLAIRGVGMTQQIMAVAKAIEKRAEVRLLTLPKLAAVITKAEGRGYASLFREHRGSTTSVDVLRDPELGCFYVGIDRKAHRASTPLRLSSLSKRFSPATVQLRLLKQVVAARRRVREGRVRAGSLISFGAAYLQFSAPTIRATVEAWRRQQFRFPNELDAAAQEFVYAEAVNLLGAPGSLRAPETGRGGVLPDSPLSHL